MAWLQLDDILKDQAAEAQAWASQPPSACPNDGTPLQTGPDGQLFCPFDGYAWPRDGRGPP